MKTAFPSTVCLLAAAVALTACGPVVPASPTWQQDVRPLLVARCIRCHDLPTRGDPLSLPRPTIGNFNFDTLTNPIQPELLLLKELGPQLVRGPRPPTLQRMPPPPAETLEDWQIEILDNWAKNPR